MKVLQILIKIYHSLLNLTFSVPILATHSTNQSPLLSNRNSCSEKRLRTKPSETELRQVIQAKPPKRTEKGVHYTMCAKREILCWLRFSRCITKSMKLSLWDMSLKRTLARRQRRFWTKVVPATHPGLGWKSCKICFPWRHQLVSLWRLIPFF